jgi:hypothetical protein
MVIKALAIGVIGLGLAGCDSDLLHQDRPGGSDYQRGSYRTDGSGDRAPDSRGDYRRPGTLDDTRRNDDREYCARYPEECRRR